MLEKLLDAMSLEDQASLLSGTNFWITVPLPQHGIPSVKLSDGPNGARGALFKDGPRTACFPVGIALAASWDTALVKATGEALGREARLKGARVLLAPTVNLQRTVFNGRNFECYSEDPWLTSEMACAYINGVQSTGVAATIKHFVGNESEFQRTTMSSEIPERALREIYLLPFERAVKQAKVMALMTGYNRVDGTFMADHRRLVTEVLRDEWGFDGLVMTDWYAEHDTVQSVLAGCDLEMPGPARKRGQNLVDAVRLGRLPAQAVRDCARRVLLLAQRVGSFDDPVIPAERADDLPEHRSLIRRLGAAGTVLLKNQGNLLPIQPKAGQTVALIGLPAVMPQIMGGGSATVNAHYRSAPLDALRAACPDVHWVHQPGADIFRAIPVCPAPMAISYFDSLDCTGPVIATHESPNGEVLWIGNGPPGVNLRAFSCTAKLRYTAEADGEYAFSLISAGLSRASLNGEAVLDAWDQWQRGENYFGSGTIEVVHRRSLRRGEVVEIAVEFSSNAPQRRDSMSQVRALRVGVARVLGAQDIAQAVAVARNADMAIVFAGLNAEWDNEGMDRSSMDLPHHQNALVAQVVAAQPRTVVVLQSGSPLLLPWLAQVPAVLQAWYPGQECGNAIADVLLGKEEPGGRLPQTWPAQLQDTVAFDAASAYPGVDGHVHYREELLIGYRHHDAHEKAPLFPFGHGLSYTQFDWLGLQVLAEPSTPLDSTGFETSYRVLVTLRNSGARTGDAVVQLYLATTDADTTLPRPPQWLVGFGKLRMQAGQTGTVEMRIAARAFASYDAVQAAWVARPGHYQLRASASSRDIRLQHQWRHGS